MDETMDEALCALDDLCDTIDCRQEKLEEYFHPESDEKLSEELTSIKKRLTELGEVVVEPLTDYLYNPDSYGCIIAADVLGEIGSPAAIPALIDAIETDADYLCGITLAALVKIGAPAVQPLIDRIGYRIDNPEIGEYGHKIDIIYTLGTLSEIRDPRSFSFMVKLLDRFEGDDDHLRNLSYLCTCFYDQHNPEIIPRLKAIAEKYRDVSGTPTNISVEAEDSIMRLGVYQVIRSEDWEIYGCCRICKNYDRDGGVCLVSGNYEPRGNFCFECRPNDAFDCGICSLDGCNIFDLPSVDIDLKYRLNGDELVDRFRVMTDYHQDSGFISIENDLIEFNFTFCSVDDLIGLKEFLKGEGDCFSGGVRLFDRAADRLDPIVAKDVVGLIRQGDYVAAAYKGHEFEVELVLDSAAIGTLIPVIDTQRFLLLCDSYRLLDEFYDMQEVVSKIRGLIESPTSEEETPESECDHKFELLRTHKKYTVHKCVKCGKTKKEFS
ncbi:MAG: HEAT repeat domain-containing protein [Euryarchaeota archaeon]|nr:HEAT repeat domain-containing protein [Euryarchaeota archaeon]